MTTLYRKYRPQTFQDLVGQEYIVQTITNELLTDKVAHAYLFSGPRGTGKTTLARLLAKAVNCQNRQPDSFEPCDTCSSCQEIATGRNVDVIEIDAASQTGVDNVRENIIENAQFKPTRSKYKVFIIDEVHMLSNSAFNALLKTIEEPPTHIIFILATTELHKLPATIISRCQRFNFKKIPYHLMNERLHKLSGEEHIEVEQKVLDRIIAKSEGCLRDAESLLGQIFSLNLKKITEDDIQAILPSSANELVVQFADHIINQQSAQALNLLSTLVHEGVALEQFIIQYIELLRDIIIIKTTLQTQQLETNYSIEQIQKINSLAQQLTIPQLLILMDLALKRKQDLKTTPLPQLPLELLVIEYSTIANSTPPIVSTTLTPPSALPTNLPPPPPKKLESELTENKETPEPSLAGTIKNALSHITGKHAPTITLDQVKEKWEQFITVLSGTSHSLTFIIRMCTLDHIDQEGLHVKIPYAFHKEKLLEIKNKKLIEEVLESVYHERFALLCDLATPTTTQTETPPDTNFIADLATEFGGEVVN